MTVPAAIVLVIDRLGAGYLAPHGATWLDTPHFNRLASQSLLCENVLADSPWLEQAYRAYGRGDQALASTAGRALWQRIRAQIAADPSAEASEAVFDLPTGDSARPPQLAALAAAAGTRTVLLTDTPAVAEMSFGRSFAEHVLLPLPAATHCADDVADTGLAQLFQAAADVLSQLTPPFVLWIHAHGMAGPWDAPLDLRNQFADEEDPTPPTFVTPPELVLPSDFDPDELLGFNHAYAGQISLLDLCLGTFLEVLDQQPWASEALLALTSPRGYPLGQHRRVGPCDEALHAELLHVPLFLRMPGGQTTLQRRQSLVQPADLHATLLDACGLQPAPARSLLRMLASDDSRLREVACAISHHERAIRTPAWLLRETLVDERLHHELYVKPDDYWETNEIANRAGDIVQLLSAELDRRHAAALGNTTETAPLAEPLSNIWR